MEYVVTHSFTDKETKEHYAVGEKYPHSGSVSDARIEELSTDKNKRGIALIEKVSKKDEAKEEKVDGLVTREEVEKMKFFSVKSLASKNGIEVDGKNAAELKAEIIEKLNL